MSSCRRYLLTTHLLKSILTIELLVLLSKNLSLSDRSNLVTKSKSGLVIVADEEKETRKMNDTQSLLSSMLLTNISNIMLKWLLCLTATTFRVCCVHPIQQHSVCHGLSCCKNTVAVIVSVSLSLTHSIKDP